MRRVIMAGLAALAVVSAVHVLGCGRRETTTEANVVGSYRLGLVNRPNPPNVGDNTMTIVIRDANDQPVRGAELEVVVFMPAMGTMPYMESRGKIYEVRAGQYQARYALSMGGEWDITLRIRSSAAPPAEASYRLSTSTRGIAFMGGSPGPGASKRDTSAAAPDTLSVGQIAEGALTIDAARRQEIGVRIAPVQTRTLSTKIRAAGTVVTDETRRAEVALKFPGWVRDIRADYTGRRIRRGEVLFTVYSPELWSAQEEYLEALRGARGDTAGLRRQFSEDLVNAARRRLALWDFPPEDIRAIERTGRPREALPVRSPVTGVVTEKSIVSGSAFQAGQVLYRIERLDPIWVIANVHQMDLPQMRAGLPATVLVTAGSPTAYRGKVAFVQPELDSMTRTGLVRVVLGNPGMALKPGMFVQVEIDVSLGQRLAIPESAVIPVGPRSVVFVELADGRLAPRDVQLGPRAQGYYAVAGGLREGERVVVSGNFLIAAESRLRSRSW